jgi:hypothetical protein
MPKDPTEHTVTQLHNLEGVSAVNQDNPYLARTVTPVADLAPKRRARAVPQMRALRNVLGDEVLNIIPGEIREAIDAVHGFHKHNPDAFQVTPFESETDKEGFLVLARAYAEMAGTHGYTIYTQDDEDASKLVWKVTDRRGTKAAIS